VHVYTTGIGQMRFLRETVDGTEKIRSDCSSESWLAIAVSVN